MSSAPPFDASLGWIWRAWERLTDGRRYMVSGMSVAMGGTIITPRPQSISWEQVRLWIDANHIGEDDGEVLEVCIMRMDAEFLKWWAKQHSDSMQAMAAQAKI